MVDQNESLSFIDIDKKDKNRLLKLNNDGIRSITRSR